MARLDKERQKVMEPKRVKECKEILTELGLNPKEYEKKIEFVFKQELITFFPYSGWHTGKSIIDGRGFKKLVNQLIK